MDGLIDESDELGSAWLDRFESTTDLDNLQATTTNYATPDSLSVVDQYHKFGFGDYLYDSNGNTFLIMNRIVDDSWGSDGLDNDGDWGLFKDA